MKKIKVELLIFIIIFAAFLIIQLAFPSILDVDPYYHYKFSLLLSKGEINNTFPWLFFTDLNQNFSNQWWLFQYLLLPFTLLGFPLGIKIFIAIFSSLLLTTFYLIIKKLGIEKPTFWLLVLIFSSSIFLFRIQVARSLLINVNLAIIGLFFLIKEKKIFLFFWTIIFILTYHGSFFIIGILLLSLIISHIIVREKINLMSIFSILAGIIVGIILHPQPLNYLNALWQNYSLIPLILGGVNLQTAVELGRYSPLNFISSSFILFSCLCLTIVLYLPNLIKPFKITAHQRKTQTFLIILTCIFLMLTLLFVRFIEYLAPFTILLTAYSWTIFQNSPKSPELQKLLDNLKIYLKKPIIKTLLILAGAALIFVPVKQLLVSFKYSYPINRYQETAEWLKNNTPAKSIIFHTSWDAFPRLFFYNDHNYYLVGLDPTFMYLYNKDLYWLWRNITEKSIACPAPIDKVDLTSSGCAASQQTPRFIAQTIKTQFNAEYIWVNDYCYYQDFKKFLEDNPEYFIKKIETTDSAVFKIITTNNLNF